jgi:hypothetical protein
MFEISSIVLDHGTGAFEIRRERGRCDLFLNFPCIEGLVSLETFGDWGTASGNGSLTPSLSIKGLLMVIGLFFVWFSSWLSLGAGTGEQMIVLVEHCEVSISSGGPLLVIHASSG